MNVDHGILDRLLTEVRACTVCQRDLPLSPRPVVQVDARARILIAGQAPGRSVHESGVPFDDASGDRLREWMGIDRDTFYDAGQLAILPMGFCYPGTGSHGDLPLATLPPSFATGDQRGRSRSRCRIRVRAITSGSSRTRGLSPTSYRRCEGALQNSCRSIAESAFPVGSADPRSCPHTCSCRRAPHILAGGT